MTDYVLHSDQDLLALAARGDSMAEEMLLSRDSRTVRACARPLFLMGGDSEDLIQVGEAIYHRYRHMVRDFIDGIGFEPEDQ